MDAARVSCCHARMQAFIDALQAGDYDTAYKELGNMPEASTPIGAASAAFLLALMGRFDEAEQRLQGANAPAVEVMVRGERMRTARRSDANAASALSASTPLDFLGVYPGMAVAMIQGDTALIETIKQDMQQIQPVSGRLHYRDDKAREFSSIEDSDDTIGQMFETYGGNGLLFIPMATVRRIDFLPVSNFMDLLVPKAQLQLTNGETWNALMPLLYAGSTSADDAAIRAGRMTTWDYVGSARRGMGQRDFVLDGGTMVGMQHVAAIELQV